MRREKQQELGEDNRVRAEEQSRQPVARASSWSFYLIRARAPCPLCSSPTHLTDSLSPGLLGCHPNGNLSPHVSASAVCIRCIHVSGQVPQQCGSGYTTQGWLYPRLTNMSPNPHQWKPRFPTGSSDHQLRNGSIFGERQTFNLKKPLRTLPSCLPALFGRPPFQTFFRNIDR